MQLNIGDDNIRSHNGDISQRERTLYLMNVKVTSHRQYVTHSMYRLQITAYMLYKAKFYMIYRTSFSVIKDTFARAFYRCKPKSKCCLK